jgi:hypothetical protein
VFGDFSVTSARHKQVVQRSTRRRLLRLALPAAAATLVTGSVVGVAVGAGGPDAAPAAAARPTVTQTAEADSSSYLAGRVGAVSRSAKRVTLHKKPAVKDREYMTAPLNLWAQPSEKGKPLDVLEEGKTVALTGVVKAGFAQILHDGQLRWVNDDYLSDEKPEPEPEAEPEATTGEETSTAPAGLSTAPCPDGSGTESGLTSSAVRLYRAVCNAFPALSSYGGYDGHGEHSSGRAIDFMVTDSSLGQAVADWCRAHASELGLYDIIWSQRIWTLQRSSEGWRAMEDRGSATANHYDHVHVQVG